MTTQTAAIVTTLKQPGPGLESFLRYHNALGFSRFFLFFDDPADTAIETARRFRRTRVIKTDARLQRQWQHTKIARDNPWFYNYVDTELKVRQTLNVEIAIQLAREENIDWLLHIDCDELFHPLTGNVQAHFAAAAKRKLNNLVYANYEGVPERTDIDDFFQTVTLFKKNFSLSSKRKLTSKQLRLIRKSPQLPDHLFLFYANGKSAARVAPGLEPDGGHRFRYSNDKQSGKVRRDAVLCQDAIILHYPCCGFKNFWRKYKMLGAFADRWFDRVDIVKAIGSFHIESRDIVARGDRRAARKFYNDRVVIREREFTQRLIEQGVCCRIRDPAMLLQEMANSRQ